MKSVLILLKLFIILLISYFFFFLEVQSFGNYSDLLEIIYSFQNRLTLYEYIPTEGKPKDILEQLFSDSCTNKKINSEKDIRYWIEFGSERELAKVLLIDLFKSIKLRDRSL